MDTKKNPTRFQHTWATRWLVPIVIGLLILGLLGVIVLSLV